MNVVSTACEKFKLVFILKMTAVGDRNIYYNERNPVFSREIRRFFRKNEKRHNIKSIKLITLIDCLMKQVMVIACQ